MVLQRNAFAMGFLTIALGIFMCAAALPLFSSSIDGNVMLMSTLGGAANANATMRMSVSFFERCPLNTTNDDRVIAARCEVLTVDRGACTQERIVYTIGKLASVCAVAFTGFSVVMHLAVEHLRNWPRFPHYMGKVAAFALLSANVWWAMGVVALHADLCKSGKAVDLPAYELGPAVPVAGAGTAVLLVTCFAVIFNSDFGVNKKY